MDPRLPNNCWLDATPVIGKGGAVDCAHLCEDVVEAGFSITEVVHFAPQFARQWLRPPRMVLVLKGLE